MYWPGTRERCASSSDLVTSMQASSANVLLAAPGCSVMAVPTCVGCGFEPFVGPVVLCMLMLREEATCTVFGEHELDVL